MKKFLLPLSLSSLLLTFIISCESPIVPEPSVYTVTFDSQGGSEITPQIVTKGQKVQVPEVPILNESNFQYWHLLGESQTPWDFAKNKVTKNITLVARWEAKEYTVTIAPLSHGTITASPTGGPAGTLITLTVTPETDYTLQAGFPTASGASDLTGSGSTWTFSLPSGGTTVGANFLAIPYFTLTAAFQNEAYGSVIVQPLKTRYQAHEEVTITAVPAVGYNFKNWTGASAATTPQITLQMSSNRILTALVTQNVTVRMVKPAVAPPSRSLSNLMRNSEGTKLYMYGCQFASDLWSFDISTETWTAITPVGSKPAGSQTESAIFIDGGRILRFGSDNKTWVYTVATNTWTEVATTDRPSCQPGYPFPMVYVGNGRVVHFKGMDTGMEVWEFNTANLRWTNITDASLLPSPWKTIYDATLSQDRTKINFFGTYQYGTPHTTWGSYDLATKTWEFTVPAGPLPPAGLKAVGALNNQRYLVYNSAQYSGYNSLWVFDMNTKLWIETVSNLPSNRYIYPQSVAMVGNTMYAFGGNFNVGGTNTLYNDLMIITAP